MEKIEEIYGKDQARKIFAKLETQFYEIGHNPSNTNNKTSTKMKKNKALWNEKNDIGIALVIAISIFAPLIFMLIGFFQQPSEKKYPVKPDIERAKENKSKPKYKPL